MQAQGYFENRFHRNELICEHLEMARRLARKIARRLPSVVRRDDLESAALLGLTEAASRFDSTRGEPFGAFAAKRVRGAVLDELRRSDIDGVYTWLTVVDAIQENLRAAA